MPTALVRAPLPVHALVGIDGGIGVGGKVDDAEVDAEKVLDTSCWNVTHLERRVQEEHAIPQGEIGLTAQTVAARLPARTEAARHQLAASERHRLTCSRPFHDRMRSS